MSNSSNNRFSTILTWIVLMFACFGAFYVIYGLNQSAAMYTDAQNELSKPVYSGSVAKVKLPEAPTTLNIPSWALFSDDDIWVLASKESPLPTGFTPKDLVDSPVAHGNSDGEMKISRRISLPLQQLVAAAKADGHMLVLSSAYRSIADQQQLLDEFIEDKGEALAREYVADPGSSEHHTGLSIDFSNASPSCALDSDSCSLSLDSAAWLADNAYKYGFTLRYPEGAKSVTGISFEPWHYRYVGKELAKNLYNSTITFDEFVELVR